MCVCVCVCVCCVQVVSVLLFRHAMLCRSDESSQSAAAQSYTALPHEAAAAGVASTGRVLTKRFQRCTGNTEISA